MNSFVMPDGRELHFAYTIGVLCDYSDYVLKNGQTASVAKGNIRRAVLMNRAYIDMNGLDEEPITEKELGSLPVAYYSRLVEILDKQEEEDSKVTIEVKEVKNAKPAAPKK